jgi:hypothetical protein
MLTSFICKCGNGLSLLPGEAEGTVAGGDNLVAGTAGAALQSELPALVERFVDHAEQVVLVVRLVPAVFFEVLHRVALGQGLILVDDLLLDGFLRRRSRVEFLALGTVDDVDGSAVHDSSPLLDWLVLPQLVQHLLLIEALAADTLQLLGSDWRADDAL